ncbi:hypothetical protein SCHPADRAFT_640761 [Schizopora paradoxa]|uniref:Uncharacterized protein n=1 Tax=Schizopora paradoxa TaxID=27342 RepID=A0A0H2R897_9AGAM|nr:hypothetical protein SCHPADRAFT_640761 [Schizopora paradoxa]
MEIVETYPQHPPHPSPWNAISPNSTQTARRINVNAHTQNARAAIEDDARALHACWIRTYIVAIRSVTQHFQFAKINVLFIRRACQKNSNQSIARVWRLSHSRPRMRGKGIEKTPRAFFSDYGRAESRVRMPCAIKQEAIGSSRTALMSMGFGLRTRWRRSQSESFVRWLRLESRL